jgi:hypothetical protein
MAFRHKAQAKAKGGGVTPKRDADKEEYTGKGSNLMKEAHEMKRGGKAHGGKGKHRLDKKARGGSVKAGKVHEGADMKTSPYSAAHTGQGGNPAEGPAAHTPKGEK